MWLRWVFPHVAPERERERDWDLGKPSRVHGAKKGLSVKWIFLCDTSSRARDHESRCWLRWSHALVSELTQVARLNKCWKEFGVFSWVTFVRSGGIVNSALEGDYRVLLFLSFIGTKVCVCLCGFDLSSQLSDFIICALSAGILFASVHKGRITINAGIKHVPCLLPDSWWEQHWIWPPPFPLPSWQNSRCWREAVSLKEAEEVEEKLGPGRGSNSGSLELIFQYCDGENPKEIYWKIL